MGLNRVLQGLVWAWRMGRVNRRYHVIISLISGASLFLLLLTLTPHPAPHLTHPSIHHGAARRIQQEADDYTGSRNAKRAVQDDARVPDNHYLANSPPGREVVSSSAGLANTQETDGVKESPYKMPGLNHSYSATRQTGISLLPADQHVLTPPLPQAGLAPSGRYTSNDAKEALAQLAEDIPRTIKERQQVVSAQERALAAQQHGYRLTQDQKKLLSRLSPATKTAMEHKAAKMRERQDRTYLDHLRAKRQIVPRPGGGEEIYSSPRMTVRFPVALKKATVGDWVQPQYAIFTNLTHRPWVKMEGCQNYSIRFYPPASHSTRALASFPSSGNTWVRYLIEGASGVFTGSLYDDSSLTRKGMYGEGVAYDSGMTVLQKSHGYTTGDAMNLPHEQRLEKNHMGELSGQGVIVIRNPFKALISHRHLDVGGHTGYAPKAHFLGKGWADFVSFKIQLWRDFYMDWATRTDPHKIHITHYENLRSNPIGEMRKILSYLDIRADSGRLACLGRNTDGLFKRKPSKNVPLDFSPFTMELKEIVYKAIDEVNSALEHIGKEMLPLDNYEIYDAREAKVAKYLRNQGK